MDGKTEERPAQVVFSESEIAARIAGAVKEVPGVEEVYTGFSGSLSDLLGMAPSDEQGIKLSTKDGDLIIDIHIVAEYGVRIPQLAWEIQRKVIEEVESFAGVSPAEVNIHVQGVVASGEGR